MWGLVKVLVGGGERRSLGGALISQGGQVRLSKPLEWKWSCPSSPQGLGLPWVPSRE